MCNSCLTWFRRTTEEKKINWWQRQKEYTRYIFVLQAHCNPSWDINQCAENDVDHDKISDQCFSSPLTAYGCRIDLRVPRGQEGINSTWHPHHEVLTSSLQIIWVNQKIRIQSLILQHTAKKVKKYDISKVLPQYSPPYPIWIYCD